MSYRTCCLSPVDSVPFHIVEYTFIGAMSEMNLCIVSLDQKLQFSVTELFFFFLEKRLPSLTRNGSDRPRQLELPVHDVFFGISLVMNCHKSD